LDGAGGDGLDMPTPFSPKPTDPSSGRDADARKAPSTQTKQPVDTEPDATTPIITRGSSSTPQVTAPEPPTIISSNRPLRAFDQLMISESIAGRKLGHFELIEAVGAGGMAAVLKARDLDLGRIVALKILPPDMAEEPENIVRFKQEARAAAKLDHDNIARVYFIGEDQNLHFIAFEFVEGDNLRQLMEASGGTIAVPDAVSIMLQVSAGLGHAAERGVVHRDIKPSNIIVTPDGRAKIVDMGLARSLDPRNLGQLTDTGITLGTFDYVSPEQAIDPHLADVRSDIYSLGCTFYHALTGRPPVPEGTAAKKLDAQKNIVPPDPRGFNPDIPADLAAILARMMAKDPDRRYQNPEHLASHLRALAKKLGIPMPTTGGSTPASPASPNPAKRSYRLSLGWALTAVAIAIMVGALLSNGFRKDPQGTPNPDDKGNGGEPIDPGGPSTVVSGPKDAVNTTELLAHLRQGVKHIRLTGPEYDLVKYRGDDGHPVEAILAGDDVRIEGVDSPTFVLGHVPMDAKIRQKTLTIRGPGSGKATVKGIRFVLPDRDGDVGEAGLLIGGFDRVTVEECTFATTGQRAIQKGPAALAMQIHGGSVTMSRCYFAPGCVGVEIDGPGKVSLTECALAPHYSGIQVSRSTTESVAGDTELLFNHCSALLTAIGAVVEIEDAVSCVVRAGHCLFAGPERAAFDDIPIVVRQRKTRAAGTRYDGDGESRPNAYFHVAAYADGEATYTFAEAAREKLPMNDVERPIKYPWKDRDPYSLLTTQPPDSLTAFTPNLRLPELRVKDDPVRPVVGTRYLGKDPLYSVPLRSIDSETRDLTVKVWDPSLADMTDDLPPGVFGTQAAALAALRSGDTLLIRHTGRLEVDPHEFTRKDTNIIIKPDAGHKPVLVPAQSILKRAAALFKLYGGKLVLDGLHFRLPADRAPAVAVLPGGGQLELRNSVVTMEEGEDLAVVSMTDPRGEMMMGSPKPDTWPVPRLTIENAFIRGKGKLLSVKGSRPFEFDIKNVLAALDDTMLEIEASTADPSSAGSGVIRMTRLTAFLSGALLHMRASDRKSENGAMGLARTEITATGCIFTRASQSSEPLVRADRIDSREQLERWLSWRGKHNVYDNDKRKTMLELRPSDVEASSIKHFDGERWLEITLEPMDPDPFANVIFEHRLPEAGQSRKFLGVKPIDFRMMRIDPPRETANETGAPADVPGPFADE
jgi:serine/threonine protein kinase